MVNAAREYNEDVKRILFAAALLLPAALAVDPEARNVKTVYLLKMTAGLDQYLANELTQGSVYAVTTDPQRADALFTDSVGEAFEKRFAELYPPPPAPKVDKDKKDEKDEKKPEQSVRLGSSTWSRGQGTVFLVDRKTRNVLWSMHRTTKNTQRAEMVAQAKKITEQLKKDLGMTPQGAK